MTGSVNRPSPWNAGLDAPTQLLRPGLRSKGSTRNQQKSTGIKTHTMQEISKIASRGIRVHKENKEPL